MEKIAVYLRLSKEDELNRDESNSITNQRELILNYIRRDRNLRKMEVVELKDDGYSGKNMNRPGMERLLEMVRRQQVSCIIVKDMSRFSRDYLVLGKYTEQIFPFMGIRFIAINDDYDSTECVGGIGEIDIAFKQMLYDFYSEDLSQKVKSAMTVRKREGRFMSVYAPYGYRKCADDHNRLEIEPEGAEIVRRIFSEYAAGKSMCELSRELNREQVKTPAAYIRERDGRDYFRKDSQKELWSVYAVSRILKNELYGGTLIWHKYHSAEVGKHGGIPYPKETWERIENAVPALIDKNTLDAVRNRLKQNRKNEIVNAPHVLVGKVYCGNCGYAMSHSCNGRPSFICHHRFFLTDPSGCVKSIRDENLEPVILQLIQEKIRDRIGMEDILQQERAKLLKRVNDAKRRLSEMQESYTKIDADLLHAYEAYREGRTERETYLEQKSAYEQMLAQLEENTEKQRRAIEQIESENEIPEGWMADSECLQISRLDRNIVELLVRKIIVGKDHTLEVVWNFGKEPG